MASEKIKRQELIPTDQADQPGFSGESVREQIVTEPASYLPQEVLQKRRQLKQKFEAELKTLTGKKVHLIVFPLGGEEYAFDLSKAREVVVTPSISKMPHTPDYISGVTEIRNRVVVVYDLSKKFRLSHQDESENTYTMVVDNDHFKVGVLVDKVPDTLIVQGEEIKSASGICADTTLSETYIKGIVKINERMIFYIDVDELIAGDRVNLLSAFTEEMV